MARIMDAPKNRAPIYVATMRASIKGIRDQLDREQPNREVIDMLWESLEGALDLLIEAMPYDRR